jgi:hypothetical protein
MFSFGLLIVEQYIHLRHYIIQTIDNKTKIAKYNTE